MTETKANYTSKLLAAEYYGLADSDSKFDRNVFMKTKTKLNSLEKTLVDLNQKPSRDNQRAAGLQLMGNTEYFIKMRNGSGIAQDMLGDVVRYGSNEMNQYSVNNQKEMYGLLGTKEKSELISSGAMAKMAISKGDEKPDEKKAKFMEEYNNFAEASNLRSDLLEVDLLDKDEAYEVKAKFMQNQLQYSPKWFATAMKNQSENRDFIESIHKEYVSRLEVAMNQTLITEKGDFDGAKVNKFADTNHKLQIGAEKKNPVYFTGLQNFAYNAIIRQDAEAEAKKKEKETIQMNTQVANAA